MDGLAQGFRISQLGDAGGGGAQGQSRPSQDVGINCEQNQNSSTISPVYDEESRKRQRVSEATHLDDNEFPIPGPSAVGGLSSVLAWDIFSGHGQTSDDLRSALSNAKQRQSSHHSGLESASCAAAELFALAAAFEGFYLPAMPVLDITDTRRLVRDSGEFGIAWSAESCLVLLVAALGSMCRQGGTNAQTPWGTPQLSSPASSLLSGSGSSERRTPSALRYWNMARKRLVWATSSSGLVAAQCQFLAG